MGEFQELMPIEGMEASAVSADLYGDGRDDLVLFYFQEGANFAAVYTTSKVTSASINWNLKIKRHFVKAIMVNTQNANTFTGIKGAQGLKEIATTLAKNLTLKSSQAAKGTSEVVKITDLLFASTGVIGEEFPYTKIKNTVPELVKNVDDPFDKGNYKALNYNGIIGLLVESIKELKEEITELKNAS